MKFPFKENLLNFGKPFKHQYLHKIQNRTPSPYFSMLQNKSSERHSLPFYVSPSKVATPGRFHPTILWSLPKYDTGGWTLVLCPDKELKYIEPILNTPK